MLFLFHILLAQYSPFRKSELKETSITSEVFLEARASSFN